MPATSNEYSMRSTKKSPSNVKAIPPGYSERQKPLKDKFVQSQFKMLAASTVQQTKPLMLSDLTER